MRAVVLALLAVLTLAGCSAPGPDLQAQAAADFDALVQQAADVDAATLRTLERERPEQRPCGTDGTGRQTAHVAAGVLSILADEDAGAGLVDDLARGLDPDRWDAIGADAEAGVQRAFADPDGIVATLTARDGLLVIAVFSPCV